MDDHRWALKVWEMEKKYSRYTLIHADYHWDACYDFRDNPEHEARLRSASPIEVADLVAAGEFIKFDSFIAPAILRGLVNIVHYYCFQEDGEKLDDDLLQLSGAKQIVHSSVDSLVSAPIDGPLIFDLCLDLFNNSDQWEEGSLWPDEDILHFLESVSPLVAKSDIVTIAMSFNYSGTHSDTKHLAKLVVPILLAQRQRHRTMRST